MTRDELVAELLALPANADIATSIGHYRIDGTGIVRDADRDEIFLEFPAGDMRFALERLEPPLSQVPTFGCGTRVGRTSIRPTGPNARPQQEERKPLNLVFRDLSRLGFVAASTSIFPR